MRFVSIHSHTTISYGDGFASPASHMERIAELGMVAGAVTEHGNVSSHVQWEKGGRKYGVKPIFGLEAYVGPESARSKWHQTILAMNAEGMSNLNKLITAAWRDGFYYLPTASWKMLTDYGEGLIVTSGCSGSQLACVLLGGKGTEEREEAGEEAYSQALKLVRRYKKAYGDRYYLEVQRFPELARTRALNSLYERLSADTGVELVATADVHYPRPEQNEMHKILHAATRNTGTVDKAEADFEYDVLMTYPESDNQIYQQLKRTGLSKGAARKAIENTAVIAERCNVTLPTSERLRFPISRKDKKPGWNTLDVFKDWIRKGIGHRIRTNHVFAVDYEKRKKEYVRQLKYECGLMESKDFLDYFLMMADALQYSKNQGIAVGPGRGSAVASLVLYVLRITEINPMMFPMIIFERFISEDRDDYPDVDLDFESGRRNEVYEYLAKKYGREKVAYLGTFTKYRGKLALSDVARVNQIPMAVTDSIKAMIPERLPEDERADMALADTVATVPAVKEAFDRYPALYKALELEGNYKTFGVHAAGIVLANTPITDFCAMYYRKIGSAGKERMASAIAYDKKDAEHLGLLKIDALGLSTMEMIANAVREIGMTLDELYSVPLTDEKTMEAFRRNDLTGIFQFEGRTTRGVCKGVRPDTFLELADISALSRPGPLFSGMATAYVATKHRMNDPFADPAELEILDRELGGGIDALSKITAETKYQIVYQEQIMLIVREIGNFTWQQTNQIRSIISKKKGESAFIELHDAFISGAAENGIDEHSAQEIWSHMTTAGSYSFNIPHSVSYAMIAYWQQWIKQHHPQAFFAASLHNVSQKSGPDSAAKLRRMAIDCENHGVRVRPPHVALSAGSWTSRQSARGSFKGKPYVLAGFEQIKGIGESTARSILDFRSEYELESWDQLINVKGIGKKTVERIEEFCSDPDPFMVQKFSKALSIARGMCESGKFGLPMPTHKSDEIPLMTEAEVIAGRERGEDIPDKLSVVYLGVASKLMYRDEVEETRKKTNQSEEEILAGMQDPNLRISATLTTFDDGDDQVNLKFNRWRFPKFRRGLETIEMDNHLVLVVAYKYPGIFLTLQVKELYILDPFSD